MPNIVVVGSANTDMVVKSPRIPGPGETVIGGEFLMAAGGKGANQAVAAARLGAHVTFVACLGNDVFGDQAIAGYQREGIDTSYIVRDPEAASGVALDHRRRPGRKQHRRRLWGQCPPLGSRRGTRSRPDRPGRRAPGAARSAHRGRAREPSNWHTSADVPVILNPAPAQEMDADSAQMVAVATPNEHEIKVVVGQQDQDAAIAAMLDAGTQTVLVTIGKRGVLWATGATRTQIPAFQVQAVDTTAAGDAFNGGLACALGQGKADGGRHPICQRRRRALGDPYGRAALAAHSRRGRRLSGHRRAQQQSNLDQITGKRCTMPPSYQDKQSGQTVEYMPDLDTDRLAETLIAFANSDGGTVLIGVDESGQIDSSLMQEEIEDALRLALAQCRPGVRTQWQRSETKDGEAVAILVPRSTDLHSLQDGRVLVRAGTENRPLVGDAIRHLAATKSSDDSEIESVPGSKFEDLDPEMIAEYRAKREERQRRPVTADDASMLVGMGALTEDGMPTVTGLLLFGHEPQALSATERPDRGPFCGHRATRAREVCRATRAAKRSSAPCPA